MVTSINADLWQAVQQFLTGQFTPLDLQERLRLLQEEASRLQCALDLVPLRQAFEAVIERHIADLPQAGGHAQIPRQALEVAQELQLGLQLWQVQNLLWSYLNGAVAPLDLPSPLDLSLHLVQVHTITYPISSFVTPAHAGVQSFLAAWIPACTGMTRQSPTLISDTYV